MLAHDHDACAQRIERSLERCADDDHELKIEGAMLAAAHRLNAHFHRLGATQPGDDLMHTYLLTINEHRRLGLFDRESLDALGAIEDMRPAFVRGDHPGGAEAAQRATRLLALVQDHTSRSRD